MTTIEYQAYNKLLNDLREQTSKSHFNYTAADAVTLFIDNGISAEKDYAWMANLCRVGIAAEQKKDIEEVTNTEIYTTASQAVEKIMSIKYQASSKVDSGAKLFRLRFAETKLKLLSNTNAVVKTSEFEYNKIHSTELPELKVRDILMGEKLNTAFGKLLTPTTLPTRR